MTDAGGDAFQADPSWKSLGPSLWFDPTQRRLILRARVVLREGFLEQLLCLRNTKEHESILATDAPPRLIHAGLLLTGAQKGHPVRYQPRFEPPTGSPIAIELQWDRGGQGPPRLRRRVDQGREARQAPGPGLGLRRQRPVPRPRLRADDLRRRRGAT
jgi:hypothetical protein